ncbi:hypothetical protein H0H93_011913 [Arthromyces matolae]|nr:hypothetical protein H0H93_011913 [Arthromyces matolae]
MAPLHIPNEFWITLSYICFLLCAIPLPWHLEAWNTGTCLYMVWAGLSNLNQAINATVWNGNAINWAPVWCDISARFFLGANVAIPCASLCINRRLYQIASVRSVTVTRAEKRRAVLVDLAIGIGIPVLYMTLQYIVQGHRFNIFGDIGCFPETYNTPVAIVLVSLPPIIIGLVSAVYSILSIRAFAKSRRQFKEFLSGGSVSPNRYLRLMLLAGIETSLTVPFGLWALYENSVVGGVYPWKGWADTHSNFSRVEQIPSLIWRANGVLVRNLEMNRFLTCLCAIVFFAFFGFAEEARKHYRLGVQSVAKRMGISTTSITLFGSFGSKSKGTLTSTTGKDTLPVFIERSVMRKRDSMATFTDVSVNDAASTFDEKDEKHANLGPELSYNEIRLGDVGGTLADFKLDTISPTPSSGSSASSTASFSVPASPAIEISSVRSLEAAGASDLALPEPAIVAQPRHISDSSAV